METKDLRYAPAEYTREHQRAYTVLDIAEGDSNLVVLSQAMQHSDTVRAYDITNVDSAVVTAAVSKWILTGESIWQVLEHLRLDIHTVDSQRIALPDGFVGRVLIARVTPDADAEAPELIRLGALLHRIQQELTALNPWKDVVKPIGYTPQTIETRQVYNGFEIIWNKYTSANIQQAGYKPDAYGNYPALYPITKWVAAQGAVTSWELPVYTDSRPTIVHQVQKPDTQELYWVVKLFDD